MAPPNPPPRELSYLELSAVLDDTTFRLRPAGDVSSLAKSIAQAGQLFPIEVRRAGDAFQPITGFRRLASLQLLHRDKVLARVHDGLADEAAALLAAADALDTAPLEKDELVALRERYRARGWSTPALEELVSRAIEKAEERLEDLAARLSGLPPPERGAADEDAYEEADEAGAARPNAVARPPAEPPGPAPLGKPRGAIPAAVPERLPNGGSGGDPALERALGAAASALAEVQAGIEELGAELEEEVAAMDRAAPPGLAEAAAAAAAAGNGGEEPAEEVLADELAEDLAYRLSEISLDLSSLVDAWGDLPPHLQAIIADQLRYYSQLGDWLAAGGTAGPSKEA